MAQGIRINFKKPIYIRAKSLLYSRFCAGGIAQLGERLHGMQEVSGSIPLTSTSKKAEKKGRQYGQIAVPIV
jgi:hypothetical protein